MKKDLLTKMMIIGGIGLGCLIITIAIIWSLSGGREKKSTMSKSETHVIPQNLDENELAFQVDSLNGEKTLALVKKSITDNDILLVFDLNTKKEILLNIKGLTIIKNAYGDSISKDQIHQGQIIEAKYDEKSLDAYMVQVSGRAWKKVNPMSLAVLSEQNKIKIGIDEYDYDPNVIIVFKGNQRIPIDKVSTSDEIILRGYQKVVWSIEISAGHGFLVLKNADEFVGGTIKIGDHDIRTVEKDMKIKVSAGLKKVIITHENMSPYSKEILIEDEKEAIIDLGEYKPKVSKVTFNTVQEGVTLFIDDNKQVNSRGEITLDFGKYKIRAEKKGFIPWESILTVDQGEMQVKIDMKSEPQYIEIQTPIGAELYIDGARVGVIPVRTAITPGEHNITVRQEGYYSKNQNIKVENNGKNVNYAFPDLIRIGSNDKEESNNGNTSGDSLTNPNLKLNPTEDNY